jgi:GST-like protein
MRHGEHLLYGYKGSGSVAVEVALRRLGLPYRVVDAASWDAASALDALKRVNPLLQIPALVWPDGSTMSESAAILIELGLRHPASGLLPAEPAQRAQVLRGLVYVAAQCYAAIGVIDYPERWCEGGDEAAHQQIRAGTRQRLHVLWDQFADMFPATPYLGGEQLGALDLFAVVVSKWSGARPHLKASRPAFSALLARIEADPVVAEVFARHWPG